MATAHNAYGPGHHPSQTKHHEWRTAANSAAYLLPHLARLAEQRRSADSPPPPFTLLDVGCGPGTLTASLAQHVPPGGSVVGTDISDEVLERARAHAAARGVARNVAFRRADVFALPFADGAFDVVHAHQVLCHLDAPADAVREMVRVTRPGGLLALRESDMRMWCFWPELDGLVKFHRLSAAVIVANGGHDTGGRRLVGWVLQGGREAGVTRAHVEASFGTWCYSAPEDRRAWGEAMIERLRTGQMRSKGIEMGITTEADIDEMIDAWEQWMDTDDATLGIMNGEVIVHKPIDK